MRSIRLLVAAGAAVCALAVPAAAQAVPQGHLSQAEYAALTAAWQQGATLDADATPADVRAMCAVLAPQDTRLMAAEHAACGGMARWLEGLSGLGLCQGTSCFVTRGRKAEEATRSLVSLLHAERRAVAARGLAGSCRRAFDTGTNIESLETMADALRDLRHAMRSHDAKALDRALARLGTAGESPAGPTSAQGLARLRTCPRA